MKKINTEKFITSLRSHSFHMAIMGALVAGAKKGPMKVYRSMCASYIQILYHFIYLPLNVVLNFI